MEPDGSATELLFLYRRRYDQQMLAVRSAFTASMHRLDAGVTVVRDRAAIVDALIHTLWDKLPPCDRGLANGVALVALGGYGRRELFPYSDVDLMFLLDAKVLESAVKDSIRRLNQLMWDSGLRVSPITRTLAECERFDPENVEFTLSLLDSRAIAGDPALAFSLLDRAIPRLLTRNRTRITTRLLDATRTRHARYGNTLFHLEPNLKECPGGLRDAHVCAWIARLRLEPTPAPSAEFLEARDFLLLVRAFLHFRHGRDDNTLDWQSQDEAASVRLAILRAPARPAPDAAYWMRLYFRHARSIERRTIQSTLDAPPAKPSPPPALRPALSVLRRLSPPAPHFGFEVRHNRILFAPQQTLSDPAYDPEIILAIFIAIARTGVTLSGDVETRIEGGLPMLSAQLEDGPGLWRQLQSILTGAFAGRALRAMHTLGVLELLVPEFHGIDALVIRDAYHRYTVDEHTFVLIDTLHALTAHIPDKKTPKASPTGLAPWRTRFASILRDLPHPDLLFLAALLHDTGKGHAGPGHAIESTRMARDVLNRLDLDPYEAGLVLDLIRNHLEMSAALRRDVFDQETIRTFALRVHTPEALRMLTLFTYADINAVHPDALTPWKAENLWRLYSATTSFLDRQVDDERLAGTPESDFGEIMHRLHALLPDRRPEVARFLEGFPRRYLQTRTPDQIRDHFERASALEDPRAPDQATQLHLHYDPGVSELTLITRDRPRLFASLAGVLAAWGMNILTADAFSNAHRIVVDSFRFTDTFRTLELNESERVRFVQSARDAITGKIPVETLLAARRRGRKPAARIQVETRIDFDRSASTHSTLLQVVSQDTPGLLRNLSLTLAEHACNIEVALIDTEGEMAIDVFYLTHRGAKLEPDLEDALRRSLLAAIAAGF